MSFSTLPTTDHKQGDGIHVRYIVSSKINIG